jgi:hypothetical protein
MAPKRFSAQPRRRQSGNLEHCPFLQHFGTPNWFEPGCAQCYLPRVLSTAMMYGGDDASIAIPNALEIYFPDDTPMRSLVLGNGIRPIPVRPAAVRRSLICGQKASDEWSSTRV